MKLFVVAVENSADHLGAELITAVRAASPKTSFAGIGGTAMRAVGVPTQMDISGLAIVGYVEGIRHYPKILRKVKETARAVVESGADAVALIDSWGFMIRVAKALKEQNWPGQIIKYVAPQVWAMREGRAETLAKYADHLLTIHSFDGPFFTPHGLPVHYVGNPVFDTDYRAGDAEVLREKYKLGDRPVLGVFFGSRVNEIARLARPFTDAVQALRRDIPDLAIISPVSDSVAKDVGAAAGADLRMNDIILLPEAAKLDVMAIADVALACSGTVTTQLACAGIPTVVAYRLSALTGLMVKRLYKPDYISIVNIAAKAELMPEFVQSEVTGPTLAAALKPYFSDTKKSAATRDALLAQTANMRGAGTASAQAAQAILDITAATSE